MSSRTRKVVLAALLAPVLGGAAYWQYQASGITACGDPVAGRIANSTSTVDSLGFQQDDVQMRLASGRLAGLHATSTMPELGREHQIQQYCRRDGSLVDWVKLAE